jgi:hypothetical protein
LEGGGHAPGIVAQAGSRLFRIFPSWFLHIEFAYRNKTRWLNQVPMLRASRA